MKKFLSILIAGFIGFLGIFKTTSIPKISAEPQYFLQSERKNAIVETNTNIIDFYFDENINNYETTNEYLLINFNQNSIIYYYDLNNNLIVNNVISYFSDTGMSVKTLDFTVLNDTDNIKTNNFNITLDTGISFPLIIKSNTDIDNDGIITYANKWYFIDITNTETTSITEIKGFRIINFTYVEELESINDLVNPYIGNLTSLDPQTNENTTIDQIGNIINDTTNWFVNIFIGLSDIFYSNGTLGVWGSVLFLGVAFTLITVCLKWVISLIRGI